VTKGQILPEIARTAKENGGKVLGAVRFFKETGIKESDWLGKHWARWNDAVKEAGLQPNARQEAYDDQFLLGMHRLLESLASFQPSMKYASNATQTKDSLVTKLSRGWDLRATWQQG
jgi:hypothetical protein